MHFDYLACILRCQHFWSTSILTYLTIILDMFNLDLGIGRQEMTLRRSKEESMWLMHIIFGAPVTLE